MSWVTNLAKRIDVQGKTLEELITNFEDREVAEILNPYGPYSSKSLPYRDRWLSFTNIYHYLGRNFFRVDSSGQGPFPRTTEFKIWDVREGVVHLSLEETGIKHKISVWIDLEYRRVTKATLDGRQTWPERPLGTERWREDYVRPRWRSVENSKVVWILDLEFRYRDLRGEGKAPKDFTPGERFAQLMREWTPINCTAEDLKTVAGQPTRETEKFLEYQFDNDSGQARWKFTTTSNGTIRGVEFTPDE